MAVRRALLVPLMLMLIVIVLPMVASAQQVPLKADLSRTLWLTRSEFVLYPSSPPRCFSFDFSDLPRSDGPLYVVIHVERVDLFYNNPVRLQPVLYLGDGGEAVGEIIEVDAAGRQYLSMITSSVPKNGAGRLCISIVQYPPTMGNDIYFVNIDAVGLAPSRAHASTTTTQPVQPPLQQAVDVKREAWRPTGPDDRMLLLGAGIVAVAIVVAAFVFARR